MAAPRILIVGGGFAGMECAHKLEKKLSPHEAELRLISPTDHQLYLPLLPHVASGVLTPQSVAVPLRRMLRRTSIVPGGAVGVDPKAKAVVVRKINGEEVVERYDYLVLTPGSVTRQFDIPGVDRYAVGVKTLAEAAWIRDHVISQLDLASASSSREEREQRLQFVVVGGGYAGVETAAYLQRLTCAAVKRYPGLDVSQIKWHVVDVAPKLMPELGPRLGDKAMEILQRRGVNVSLGVSVAKATEDTVTLTDDRVLPCRTLIWTAGVAPSPLIATLGAETNRGRLVVRPDLTVPGLGGVFALGDAAAVPDLAKGGDAICPPTAQHAMRQGWAAGKNVVSALRGFPLTDYRHKDMGLVVDLGGIQAVSKPLGVQLTGLPAQVVARGYHLGALRTVTARFRTAANWGLNALAGDDYVRTGFQARRPATLKDFEMTDAYLTQEEIMKRVEAA
ncbi:MULTISPECIES: NAD(P)/FAD-dependent oxidoreductase [unclassified Streptomyces]|uniref:NAD(P)/FAD-dependent oxidoreductase n=1 Tax=unclassified Streptomyces TaxID=2593676 RepID=UPI00136E5C9E|nr:MULTISPECIES: NAD(P)/FAD-dependent oxidoreductase [unclassified Streptomyces]MYY85345.1 FAD-dependent oxidoreductase [Streptomyces sp. SID335]MYZ19461.1 FAD-dependent oxidoreductase [Streptomyces sp. SID337]NDZ86397.1 NAD(P)/FAD-dependent oxidoreductase [Streptomyces sp. SID10115]NEA01879.1 NAD(P)/FAD-dependent oxidoreductase [Streptomyces sp. SID10116]